AVDGPAVGGLELLTQFVDQVAGPVAFLHSGAGIGEHRGVLFARVAGRAGPVGVVVQVHRCGDGEEPLVVAAAGIAHLGQVVGHVAGVGVVAAGAVGAVCDR